MYWGMVEDLASNEVLLTMDGCEVLEVPLTSVTLACWDRLCCCVEIRGYDNLQSVLG
jgi:hypothetical protein